MKRRRIFWSLLVVLGVSFGAGVVWQKSALASHNCAGTSGPFGGRRINCTYYDNLAIHPGLEVFNIGNWNWPFGYYSEGLVPDNTHNNADDFIAFVQNFVFRCGTHAVNQNGCGGGSAANNHARWGVTIGHSFIVNTMLGVPGSRFEPSQAPPYNNFGVGGLWYAQDNFNAWASRVRQYDAAGLIDWNQFLTHAQVANIPGNQCGGVGGRSDTIVVDLGVFGVDQGIYNNVFCESANYITFRHPTTNQPIYRINRKCGNVTGDMAGLPTIPAHGFSASPNASVSVAPSVDNPRTATFTGGISYSGAPFRATLTRDDFILRYGSATEESLGQGTETRVFTGGSFSFNTTRNISGLGLEAGDRVCTRTSISPAAGTANPDGTVASVSDPNETTPPFCVTVVNQPYHKVYGGDVMAGGAFGSPCYDTSARIIGFNEPNNLSFGVSVGSGTQLAAFALNVITEFGSGQARNHLDPGNNGVKNLTFANTTGDQYGGRLGSAYAACAPDFWAGATGIENGPVSVGGVNLGMGQQAVRYIEGNVLITGNITQASGNFNDITQVPSYRLIVRGNIYVAPGVSELNGLFVAMPRPGVANSGKFYTCGINSGGTFRAPTASEVTGACQNRLTVYGAVVSDLIEFSRSGGSLRNACAEERFNVTCPSGQLPAERFIYTPEVWLRSDFTGTEALDSIRTLPPIL